MSKRIRSLIIVLVIVVALGAVTAVLLLWEEKDPVNTSSEESSETPDYSELIISKDKDGDGNAIEDPVKQAVIKTKDETFKLVPGDDGMVVEAYKKLPVNTYSVDSLVSSLASLTASRKVTDLPEGAAQTGAEATQATASGSGDTLTLADFGLEDPAATLEVTYHDDAVIRIHVGAEAPTGDGTYLRLNDSRSVYLVDTYTTGAMAQESVLYIGTTLMTAPAVSTEEDAGETAVLYNLELGGASREDTVKIRPYLKGTDSEDLGSGGGYIIYSPFQTGTNMDTTSFAASLSTYTSLSATQAVKAFPTAEDLKKYGLDKPFSTADIVLGVQTTGEDSEVTYGKQTAAYKFILGNKAEDGSGYYMMSTGKDAIDAVYLVSESAVPWATATIRELRMSLSFLINITTVSQTVITIDGTKNVFDLRHYKDEDDADQIEVKMGGKVLSDANFRSLYQIFMGIEPGDEVKTAPAGDPWVKLELKRTEGNSPDRSMSFYKENATYSICVDAVGDVYRVRTKDVNWLIQQTGNYVDGKDVVVG